MPLTGLNGRVVQQYTEVGSKKQLETIELTLLIPILVQLPP